MIRRLCEWIALGALVGVVCGLASALFLTALDLATRFREAHPALVFTLPLAGLVIGWVYERFGRGVRAGNNLIIDTIHDDGPEIPLRMAPMVLAGTVLTHLFGGSAGREGTAVQMGASLTDAVSHRLGVSRGARRELLAAGVAGGFGSVFGTPVAGMVFGLEFVVRGRFQYDALVPALVASVVGDLTTRATGVGHSHYPVIAALALTPLVLAKWLLFAAAVALTTIAFVELTHGLKHLLEPRLALPYRMFLGGVAVVGMWQVAGTSDYLGLSVPLILSAFAAPPVWYAFALKLSFTAVTIGTGFIGGEVTPLFCVGATLGGALAGPLGLPLPMAAGVGLAAVFATAAKTPLSLSIMAVELFGAAVLPHVMIVCAVGYVLSGDRGIYPAQRRPARSSE